MTTTPDWIVSQVIDHGPSHYYRYTVTGINLSAPDERDRKFTWNVPQNPAEWSRYDLSNAEILTHA